MYSTSFLYLDNETPMTEPGIWLDDITKETVPPLTNISGVLLIFLKRESDKGDMAGMFCHSGNKSFTGLIECLG